MKQILVQAAAHPQTKIAATAALAEITSRGIPHIYDQFMDAFAYKIALAIHTMEKQEKLGET